MQRICFVLNVKRGRLDEYRELHASVWPEMLDALGDAGWKNYSLFLKEDGMLIGYFETEDLKTSMQKMQETPINTKWQQEMSPFFEKLQDGVPDRGIAPILEVFHLD